MFKKNAFLFVLASLLFSGAGLWVLAWDWTHPKGGLQNTGNTGTEIVGPAFTQAWDLDLGGLVTAAPVTYSGSVYLPSNDGKLYRIDAATGEVIWEFTADWPIKMSPLVVTEGENEGENAGSKGLLVFGAAAGENAVSGKIYALDAETRQLKWTPIETGSGMYGTPIVVNGILYANYGTKIMAYNAADGTAVWPQEVNMGQLVNSTPSYHNGKLYYGVSNGRCYCLDAEDGEILWTSPSSSGGLGHLASVTLDATNNLAFYAPGLYDPKLYAYNMDTGALVWSKTLNYQAVGSSIDLAEDSLEGGPVNNAGIYYVGGPDFKMDENLQTDLTNAWGNRRAVEVVISEWELENGPLPADAKSYFLNLYAPISDPDAPEVAATQNVSLTGFVYSGYDHMSSPSLDATGVYIVQKRIGTVSGVKKDHYILFKLNRATGVIQWIYDDLHWTPRTDSSPDVVVSGNIVFLSSNTRVLAINAADGTLNQIVANLPAVNDTTNPNGSIITNPVVSNGQLFAVTYGGHLYAYQSANHAPSAVNSGMTPINGENITEGTDVTMSWDGAADEDLLDSPETISYSLAYSFGNPKPVQTPEEFVNLDPGQTQYTLEGVPLNTHVYWRVRAKDQSNAQGAWSAVADFWMNQDFIPEGVTGLRAFTDYQGINLRWNASASEDVVGYRVRFRQDGGQFGDPINAGNVSQYSVNGLINGQLYIFSVTAVDAIGQESAAALIAATPQNVTISVNGVPLQTNLQDAMDGLNPGQQLELSSGTFLAQALRIQAGRGLKGNGAWATIVDGGDANGAALTIDEAETDLISPDGEEIPTIIEDITFQGVETGILVNNAGTTVIIRNCLFRQADGEDFMVNAIVSGGGAKLNIINNTIADCTGSGLLITDTHAESVVKNSIFLNNGGFAIENTDADSVLMVSFSYFEGNAGGNFSANVADVNGCLFAGAQFTTDPEGQPKAYLAQGSGVSATIDAGDPADDFSAEPEPNGNRINMGAYGGTEIAESSVAPDNSSVAGGGGGGGGGGCFIATACFENGGVNTVRNWTGDYKLSKERLANLNTLRGFRDQYLMTNACGRSFVSFYYTYGPIAANVIRDNEGAKTVVRWIIVYPAVALVDEINGNSYMLRFFALFMLMTMARRVRRRRLLTVKAKD